MPAPKGRTVDGSALPLASIGSAVAGVDLLNGEGVVLRGAEVGEHLDLLGGKRAIGTDRISEGDEVLFGHDGRRVLVLAFFVGFPRVAWGIDGRAVVVFTDRLFSIPNRQTFLPPLCFGHGVSGFTKSAFMVHGVIRTRRCV